MQLTVQKQRESYKNDPLKYVQLPSSGTTIDRGTSSSTLTGYYFYQMETGENIYLHSLNITWLLKEFGDYTHFPKILEGVVLDIEDAITQDEVCKLVKSISPSANSEEISILRTLAYQLQFSILLNRHCSNLEPRKCERF